MLRYVRIPPPRMCRLRTFAFLTVDLGAGGPGFKSRRPDLKARLLPRLLRWCSGIQPSPLASARGIRSNPGAPTLQRVGLMAVPSERPLWVADSSADDHMKGIECIAIRCRSYPHGKMKPL